MSTPMPKLTFRMTPEDERLVGAVRDHIQRLKLSGTTRTEAMRFALQQAAKALVDNRAAAQ
jgi:hypothetical protein